MERRRWLGIVTGAIATAVGVVLAVPAAAFLGAPLRRRRSEGEAPIDVAALADLAADKPTRVTVQARRRRDAWSVLENVTLGAAWLMRDGDKVRALSTTCPHAGCSVDWDEAQKHFACPCHASAFSPAGDVIAGPAPRPMDALDVEVQEGRVRLAYRRFKIGVSGKEPV